MTDTQRDALNDEQRHAIDEPGNVLLIACPGSGKTRTLIYKVAEELEKLTSRRQFVIAITYTHRAADEIEERIVAMGINTQQLWIGTIHSFCLEWIIRPYSIYHSELSQGFRILDAHEAEKVLESLCLGSRPRITSYDCGYHYTAGSRVLQVQDTRKHEAVEGILQRYEDYLKTEKLVDFEHILLYAWQLIQSVPKIAKLLSQMFTFVAVDEYQDTRDTQYDILIGILRAGSGATRAMLVGDPNQSIFASLGGYAIDLSDLQQRSELSFQPMELAANYRSTERIISYFSYFRMEGSAIYPAAQHADHRGELTFNNTLMRDDLEAEVARLIRHSIEELGVAPSEVCVVAPWWVHLAGLTRSLVANLPEYEFDGPGLVPISRDVDNFWFKLARIGLTEASPRMYVSRLRWAGRVLNDLGALSLTFDDLDARAFLRISNSIHPGATAGLDYLREYFDSVCTHLSINFASVPQLAAQREAFFTESEVRVARLLREGTPSATDVDVFRKAFREKSGITVSTIHGVKGAEFDTVIAFALMDGMVPHFTDPDQAGGAKRLLYVTASRARKNLHLIAERGRMRGGGWGEYMASVPLRDLSYAYDGEV
jgi:DNA helicase-2/ATP-dependent DNA helicase PcrA